MNYLARVLVFFVFLLTSNSFLYSQIGFGVYAGLSTPNNNINDIYNTGRLRDTSKNILGNLYRDGTKLGYNLGMKIRVPLTEYFLFHGGIGWHRFPQTEIEIRDTSTNTYITTLTTTQNIIPIGVGFNYYIVRTFVHFYAVGDLTYNYISASVDYKDIPISENLAPSDSRVGFGLGGGFDFDLKLATVNLEVKYNMANLIGKAEGEQQKNFLTLNLGVFFGDCNPLSESKSENKNKQ